MGLKIRTQPPRGGCVNCGATCRNEKRDGWLCTACQRTLERLERYTATAEPLSELELRYQYGDR